MPQETDSGHRNNDLQLGADTNLPGGQCLQYAQTNRKIEKFTESTTEIIPILGV